MRCLIRRGVVLVIVAVFICASEWAYSEVQANVEAYGTNATGMQNAINAVSNAGGGVVWIPAGVTVDLAGSAVTISTPLVHIKGHGNIANGPLVIGAGSGAPVNFGVKIEGITFFYTTLSTGAYGIILQNARTGVISDCRFVNCDQAIRVPPIVSCSQHVSRFQISKCQFENSNYALFCDRAPGVTGFPTADLHFQNNRAECNIGHVYAVGMDGLVMSGNTCFFPGYGKHSLIKNNNIYLDFCNWVVINGNNLFEAGGDAILLSRFQNANITGNNIAWPGQNRPASAIRMIAGDPGNSIYNLSTVTGNNMMFPTAHGISIEDNCGFITVTGNQVRSAGNASYYYGTDSLSFTHYSFVSSSTSTNINVTGNVFTDKPLLNQSTSAVATANGPDIPLTITSGSTISLTGYYGSRVHLGYATPTTITSLSGGLPGQLMVVRAYNNNTTLAHVSSAPQILLKGGVNATIPSDRTLTLQCTATGNWIEIGRSF